MKKIISGKHVAIKVISGPETQPEDATSCDDDQEQNENNGIQEIKFTRELLDFLVENPVCGRSDYTDLPGAKQNVQSSWRSFQHYPRRESLSRNANSQNAALSSAALEERQRKFNHFKQRREEQQRKKHEMAAKRTAAYRERKRLALLERDSLNNQDVLGDGEESKVVIISSPQKASLKKNVDVRKVSKMKLMKSPIKERDNLFSVLKRIKKNKHYVTSAGATSTLEMMTKLEALISEIASIDYIPPPELNLDKEEEWVLKELSLLRDEESSLKADDGLHPNGDMSYSEEDASLSFSSLPENEHWPILTTLVKNSNAAASVSPDKSSDIGIDTWSVASSSQRGSSVKAVADSSTEKRARRTVKRVNYSEWQDYEDLGACDFTEDVQSPSKLDHVDPNVEDSSNGPKTDGVNDTNNSSENPSTVKQYIDKYVSDFIISKGDEVSSSVIDPNFSAKGKAKCKLDGTDKQNSDESSSSSKNDLSTGTPTTQHPLQLSYPTLCVNLPPSIFDMATPTQSIVTTPSVTSQKPLVSVASHNPDPYIVSSHQGLHSSVLTPITPPNFLLTAQQNFAHRINLPMITPYTTSMFTTLVNLANPQFTNVHPHPPVFPLGSSLDCRASPLLPSQSAFRPNESQTLTNPQSFTAENAVCLGPLFNCSAASSLPSQPAFRPTINPIVTKPESFKAGNVVPMATVLDCRVTRLLSPQKADRPNINSNQESFKAGNAVPPSSSFQPLASSSSLNVNLKSDKNPTRLQDPYRASIIPYNSATSIPQVGSSSRQETSMNRPKPVLPHADLPLPSNGHFPDNVKSPDFHCNKNVHSNVPRLVMAGNVLKPGNSKDPTPVSTCRQKLFGPSTVSYQGENNSVSHGKRKWEASSTNESSKAVLKALAPGKSDQPAEKVPKALASSKTKSLKEVDDMLNSISSIPVRKSGQNKNQDRPMSNVVQPVALDKDATSQPNVPQSEQIRKNQDKSKSNFVQPVGPKSIPDYQPNLPQFSHPPASSRLLPSFLQATAPLRHSAPLHHLAQTQQPISKLQTLEAFSQLPSMLYSPRGQMLTTPVWQPPLPPHLIRPSWHPSLSHPAFQNNQPSNAASLINFNQTVLSERSNGNYDHMATSSRPAQKSQFQKSSRHVTSQEAAIVTTTVSATVSSMSSNSSPASSLLHHDAYTSQLIKDRMQTDSDKERAGKQRNTDPGQERWDVGNQKSSGTQFLQPNQPDVSRDTSSYSQFNLQWGDSFHSSNSGPAAFRPTSPFPRLPVQLPTAVRKSSTGDSITNVTATDLTLPSSARVMAHTGRAGNHWSGPGHKTLYNNSTKINHREANAQNVEETSSDTATPNRRTLLKSVKTEPRSLLPHSPVACDLSASATSSTAMTSSSYVSSDRVIDRKPRLSSVMNTSTPGRPSQFPIPPTSVMSQNVQESTGTFGSLATSLPSPPISTSNINNIASVITVEKTSLSATTSSLMPVMSAPPSSSSSPLLSKSSSLLSSSVTASMKDRKPGVCELARAMKALKERKDESSGKAQWHKVSKIISSSLTPIESSSSSSSQSTSPLFLPSSSLSSSSLPNVPLRVSHSLQTSINLKKEVLQVNPSTITSRTTSGSASVSSEISEKRVSDVSSISISSICTGITPETTSSGLSSAGSESISIVSATSETIGSFDPLTLPLSSSIMENSQEATEKSYAALSSNAITSESCETTSSSGVPVIYTAFDTFSSSQGNIPVSAQLNFNTLSLPTYTTCIVAPKTGDPLTSHVTTPLVQDVAEDCGRCDPSELQTSSADASTKPVKNSSVATLVKSKPETKTTESLGCLSFVAHTETLSVTTISTASRCFPSTHESFSAIPPTTLVSSSGMSVLKVIDFNPLEKTHTIDESPLPLSSSSLAISIVPDNDATSSSSSTSLPASSESSPPVVVPLHQPIRIQEKFFPVGHSHGTKTCTSVCTPQSTTHSVLTTTEASSQSLASEPQDANLDTQITLGESDLIRNLIQVKTELSEEVSNPERELLQSGIILSGDQCNLSSGSILLDTSEKTSELSLPLVYSNEEAISEYEDISPIKKLSISNASAFDFKVIEGTSVRNPLSSLTSTDRSSAEAFKIPGEGTSCSSQKIVRHHYNSFSMAVVIPPPKFVSTPHRPENNSVFFPLSSLSSSADDLNAWQVSSSIRSEENVVNGIEELAVVSSASSSSTASGPYTVTVASQNPAVLSDSKEDVKLEFKEEIENPTIVHSNIAEHSSAVMTEALSLTKQAENITSSPKLEFVDSDSKVTCPSNIMTESSQSLCRNSDFNERMISSKEGTECSCDNVNFIDSRSASKEVTESSCDNVESAISQSASKERTESSCPNFDFNDRLSPSKEVTESLCHNLDFNDSSSISNEVTSCRNLDFTDSRSSSMKVSEGSYVNLESTTNLSASEEVTKSFCLNLDFNDGPNDSKEMTERSRHNLDNMSPSNEVTEGSRHNLDNMSPSKEVTEGSRQNLDIISPSNEVTDGSRHNLDNMSPSYEVTEDSRHNLDNMGPSNEVTEGSRHNLDNMSPSKEVTEGSRHNLDNMSPSNEVTGRSQSFYRYLESDNSPGPVNEVIGSLENSSQLDITTQEKSFTQLAGERSSSVLSENIQSKGTRKDEQFSTEIEICSVKDEDEDVSPGSSNAVEGFSTETDRNGVVRVECQNKASSNSLQNVPIAYDRTVSSIMMSKDNLSNALDDPVIIDSDDNSDNDDDIVIYDDDDDVVMIPQEANSNIATVAPPSLCHDKETGQQAEFGFCDRSMGQQTVTASEDTASTISSLSAVSGGSTKICNRSINALGSWSKEDVSSWLKKSKLDTICLNLSNLDGPGLQRMAFECHRDHEVFYSRVKKSLGLTMFQTLVIIRHLKALIKGDENEVS